MKDIGFGIVGCGMIAGVHAQAITRSVGGRLVAVHSHRIEGARAFAANHEDVRAYQSIEDMVADPEIDVVCITTPSGAHLEPAVAAADAGKHLLVEKPLEISTERVDRMIEAAARNNVQLAAVFQSRFGPGAQALRDAVAQGRFGTRVLSSAGVRWFRAQSYYDQGGWRGTRQFDGGGALMNQGIHAVDLLVWIAGLPVRVSAMKGLRAHERIEVEDAAVACLEFADGSFGVIEASTACWPGEARRIEIRGSKGTAILIDDRIDRWEFEDALPEDDRIREELGKDSALRSGASDARQMDNEGHCLQIQNVIDALRGTAPLAIDGAEGRKAVQLIESIYHAADTGSSVRLQE